MNENKIFKEHVSVMNVDIHNDEIESTKAVIRSFDYDTCKFTYKLTKDGVPLSLSGASKVNVTLKFGNEAKAVLDATTVDTIESIISFVYPEQYLGYSGRVLGEVSIQYDNGQTMVAGYFGFVSKGSYIDEAGKEIPQFYWERFEDAEGLAKETIELIEKNKVVKDSDFQEAIGKTADKKEVEEVKKEVEALKKEVDTKATKQETDNKLEKKTNNDTFVAITSDMQRQIESTQSGMLGIYNSEAELNASYPNGEKGYAIVWFNENGQKVGYTYTYKNNKWAKGNVWNGIGLARDSVAPSNLSREMRNDFGSFEELDLEYQSGYLVYTSSNINAITPSPSFKTLIAECQKDDIFSIDTKVNSSTTAACIFWDIDGKYIIDYDRGVDKELYNHQVIAPFGAKYISISSIWAGNPPLYPAIRKYKNNDTNTIIATTEDIDSRLLKYEKEELEIKDGYLTYSTPNVSSIVPNDAYKTIVSDCFPGEYWNVDTTLNGSTTSAVIFWDKDGKFLKDLERGTKGDLLWYKFLIPEKAHFISATSMSKGVEPVLRKSEKAELFELDRRLSSLEKTIGPVKNKKLIVNFGDSTIGNFQGDDSVSGFISKYLKADVINVGFGGCRMGKHAQYWDAFSFYRLMDEIHKDNSDPTKWKYQDDAIQANKNGLWVDGNGKSAMPGYFPKHLADLKSIDFNKVDFITIGYGTNDYTGGNLVDNVEDSFDIKSFGGALRNGLSKFIPKFKNVKILVCTPTYRIWFNDDETFKEDSDTKDYAGTGTLIPYVNKTIEIAKEFKLPIFDSYHNLGINRYNYSIALTFPDGVHHDIGGRKIYGEGIAKNILLLY
ncbi:BppU family phage baseplate upper protein [Vagococcus fluvialis]|uniref:SGNH/GDSL hydrolase family protein n=1 Tax=Vagococcus fluvialis TaxID=2738 RepID=UPI002B2C2E3E|nr:BppU family phage baseplate upper protein [Vagococcus fluvialis]